MYPKSIHFFPDHTKGFDSRKLYVTLPHRIPQCSHCSTRFKGDMNECGAFLCQSVNKISGANRSTNSFFHFS